MAGITVNLKPGSWIENRNGICTDMKKILVGTHEYQSGAVRTIISAVGKSGSHLRGGICVDTENFAEVCRKFLEAYDGKTEQTKSETA